ncbi:flagellar hook-basal body complex protein FliE [Candidatus Phycosocius spiralis]|uniref:Flagellar hook-basal body complex protein FliE n=1 Tax=Candidatus Phycosocius spiralis TaxID=2815099 RepID=A0ABQ4PYE5_9PROT|nr:flagellar hook-basal body complex protein FliE [Candidatus Phycosocius spiralis]GIU68057.1 hypothetical protein PsB1_2211 [Candidatus Phycosocius spiralis]
MSMLESIASIGGSNQHLNMMIPALAPGAIAKAAAYTPTSFVDLMRLGFQDVENKLDRANDLIQEFAVDERVPIHQVIIAMEEARIAVELAMQVRTRLVDGYRDLMNMQL